jgi:hypothetical protein
VSILELSKAESKSIIGFLLFDDELQQVSVNHSNQPHSAVCVTNLLLISTRISKHLQKIVLPALISLVSSEFWLLNS